MLSLEILQAFANYMAMSDNISNSTILILLKISIHCIIQREKTELNFLYLFLTYIARFV